MSTDTPVTDKERLLFGAGFVFGVAVTMVIMAVVTATVASRTGTSILGVDVVLTIGSGVAFAAIVGISLWMLAFPENRVSLSLSGFGLEAEGGLAGDEPEEDG